MRPLTTQSIFLGRLGLAGRLCGSRRGHDAVDTIVAVDGGLELLGNFLGSSESIFEGVIRRPVVRGGAAKIDLVRLALAERRVRGSRLHTLTPVAMILATRRSPVMVSEEESMWADSRGRTCLHAVPVGRGLGHYEGMKAMC